MKMLSREMGLAGALFPLILACDLFSSARSGPGKDARAADAAGRSDASPLPPPPPDAAAPPPADGSDPTPPDAAAPDRDGPMGADRDAPPSPTGAEAGAEAAAPPPDRQPSPPERPDAAAADVTPDVAPVVPDARADAAAPALLVRPEIGRFVRASGSGCTATLVLPRVAITAGRCVDHSHGARPGDRFLIVDVRGAEHTYVVARAQTLGGIRAAGAGDGSAPQPVPDGFGTNDVAILHLAVPVPATVAVPAVIGTAPPIAGASVVIIGHGCTAGVGGSTKQALTSSFGMSGSELCPGDGGAPLLGGGVDGPVLGVKSTAGGGGADRWGNVVWFRESILQIALQWEATPFEIGVDRGGNDLSDHDLPMADPRACRDLCVRNPLCRGFTYIKPGVQAPSARCWLKAAAADWRANTDCTSGIDLAFEADTNRGGEDIEALDLPEARPELCRTACAQTAACVAFTYVPPSPPMTPSARCWLKRAVPAGAAAPGLVSGLRRGLEPDTNRGGGDLDNGVDLEAAEPERCRQRCAQDHRCRAFTYVPPGIQGPKARCWIKAIVPGAGPHPGLVSGVRRGLEMNTNRGGSDLRMMEIDLPVPEVCQSECAKEAACKAWTFVPPGVQGAKARCWLKNAIPAPAPAEGIVSGLRDVEFF
jgi:hypothetical protein